MMEVHQYTHIFVLGLIFAFFDAFGIGANDVANSFATSVSSKSLTLKQAYAIAVICEFGGGMLLGASVGDTIKGKIIDVELFANQPELLMLGFLCALVSSSAWVIFATYCGWPVSTTHSIIGAVAGVGIAAFGFNAVSFAWGTGGLSEIIASWFISPVVAGVVATLIFLFTKYVVLIHKNSLRRGLMVIPVYIFVAIFVGALYLILKSGKKQTISDNNAALIFGGSLGAAAAAAIIAAFFLVPWLRRKLEKEETVKWFHVFNPFLSPQPHNENINKELEMFLDHGAQQFAKEDDATKLESGEITTVEVEEVPKENSAKSFTKKLFSGFNSDVVTVTSSHVAAVHDHAVKYDPKTEYLYSFVQVLTASFASFAHGSNDLANAVGPLSAIYTIWSSAAVGSKVPVQTWTLAYGATALCIGFLLYGHNIMKSLGNGITFHTPSRGFSMEFGAALTVLTASYIGLPVSTTHCITGATAGVGLSNGNVKAVNWKMLAWCFFSWVITVPVAAVIAGALFAFLSSNPHF
ncbi:Na+/Pi symporter [Clydaea vesicula]|uniref:Phosphate transporter n=1 Tax=Clydaea vesicula TaxID=447962 RepID=A0AAD5XTU8_9FUNG|nr:Na+/Pi symporter [Clydaea vesicula]